VQPGHHHAGHPEKEDVVSRSPLRWWIEGGRSRVSSGQPKVAKGHSHDENQVSSTSSSCLRLTPRICCTPAGVVRATVMPAQLAQIPAGMRCPTTAGAKYTNRDVVHPVKVGLAPALRHESGSCPAPPPRWPAWPVASILTNHWGGQHGLNHGAAALAVSHGVDMRLAATFETQLFDLGLDLLARLEAIQPRKRPALRSHHPLLVEDRNEPSLWRCTLEIVGSCAGVTFTAPCRTWDRPRWGRPQSGTSDR